MLNKLVSSSRQTGRFLVRTGILTITILITGGCVTEITKRELAPTGTFHGSTANDRLLQITLEPTSDGLIGVGTFAGAPLSLSVIPTFHGRGALHMMGDNNVTKISLAYDGTALSVVGLEDPVLLYKTGADTRPHIGPISGTFTGKNPSGYKVRIELVQLTNLIVGTGYVYGDMVAMSGAIDNDGVVSGRAFYADGSEAVFNAEVSDNNSHIKLIGFGDPIELQRL